MAAEHRSTAVGERAWHGALRALAVAPALLLGAGPAPLQAKAPGTTHCYKGVCHRVLTVEQTRRMIGRTFTVETSYYDMPGIDRFNTGTYTSNGERFDARDPARVASADLPDGTELILRNPVNGRVSHVRVNDFGPFRGNRRLDVTRRVAEDLDFRHKGVVRLDITVVAAPREADLAYRRNRPRQPTEGHLGVVFDLEMPLLIARLIGKESSPAAETVVAAVPPAADAPTVAAGDEPVLVAGEVSAGASEALPTAYVAAAAAAASTEEAPSDAIASAEPDVVVLEADGTPAKIIPAVTDARPAADAPKTSIAAASQPVELPAASNGIASPAVAARADQDRIAAWFDPVAGEAQLAWGAALAEPAPVGEPSSMIASVAVIDGPTFLWEFNRPAPRPSSQYLLLALISALAASMLLAARRTTMPAASPARSPSPSAARGLASTSSREAGAAQHAAAGRNADHAGTAEPAKAPSVAAPLRTSRIDSGLEIDGQLRTSGRVEIAGRVHGRIEADEVIVLEGGSVDAEIVCRSIEIAGTLTGRVTAARVQIRPSGRVDADVETAVIGVELGGRLEGAVRRPRA